MMKFPGVMLENLDNLVVMHDLLVMMQGCVGDAFL